MTTAPTPSEAERLAMVLRSACALSHPRFGTDARFVEMLASQAQAIEKELRRLQAENERLRVERDEADRRAGAAERSAAAFHEDNQRFEQVRRRMKEQWGVHENVSFDTVWQQALDAKQALAELEASKNARIHALEMQALDLASENSILKRQEELEARKPLPPVRVDELMAEAGYLGASAESRADFISGLRHAEAAHGITGGSS